MPTRCLLAEISGREPEGGTPAPVGKRLAILRGVESLNSPMREERRADAAGFRQPRVLVASPNRIRPGREALRPEELQVQPAIPPPLPRDLLDSCAEPWPHCPLTLGDPGRFEGAVRRFR